MTTKKTTSGKEAVDVESFMCELDHPCKDGINRLRSAIKSLDSRIQEEVKWNSPSYKLEDHFATFKLYPPKQIQLVLHRGAKPKVLDKQLGLPDPHGLLKWVAPDRCVLSLRSSEQAIELESEVQELVRLWVAQL
ncbi:MAG: DUF1801 domain-containing protein [Methyloglobulus sp.]|nr:DUF1801 domain-containing protein [Methyloglobulus sp.]